MNTRQIFIVGLLIGIKLGNKYKLLKLLLKLIWRYVIFQSDLYSLIYCFTLNTSIRINAFWNIAILVNFHAWMINVPQFRVRIEWLCQKCFLGLIIRSKLEKKRLQLLRLGCICGAIGFPLFVQSWFTHTFELRNAFQNIFA